MRRARAVPVLLASCLVFAWSPARADTPAPPSAAPSIAVLTLRLMLEKGVITQAEYDSALREVGETTGDSAAESESFVVGKWSATLYGFIQSDYIFDSTQSFSELAAAGLVAYPNTYAADNPRSQFSVRSSHLAFRFRAPEFRRMRTSAVVDMDFLGDWASPAYNTTAQSGTGNTSGQPASNASPTETQFFTSPVPRFFRGYFTVETPFIDALFGLQWHLFGWQGYYQANAAEIMPQLYARTPQLRLSKTLVSKEITFEVAFGAMRPVQRDSAIPEGEGGIRLAFNQWTGVQTVGATGTRISHASIALTGDVRAIALPNVPTVNAATNRVTPSTYNIRKAGRGVALDAFIPVIPGSRDHEGNSLSLVGEAAYGEGIGDLYLGFGSGVAFPAGVAASPATATLPAVPATPYNPTLDPNIASIDAKNTVTLIDVQSLRAGLQYYFPGLDGKMWLSANYANITLPNAASFVTTRTTPGATPGAAATTTTNAGSIRRALNFFDVVLLGHLSPAVLLGIEYAYFNDERMDRAHGIDHRVQGLAFYVF